MATREPKDYFRQTSNESKTVKDYEVVITDNSHGDWNCKTYSIRRKRFAHLNR